MNKVKVMDVDYIPDGHNLPTCSYLDVKQGWDGELYAETNVACLAGVRPVSVSASMAIPTIGRHTFNCGSGLLLWTWQDNAAAAHEKRCPCGTWITSTAAYCDQCGKKLAGLCMAIR